jgi:hypothetical protein
MALLRNLFGGLAAGIIRLLVAAAVLVAIYLLFVEPAVRKTTDAESGVRAKIEHVLHEAGKHGNPERVIHCVEHAHGDVHRVQRCATKF